MTLHKLAQTGVNFKYYTFTDVFRTIIVTGRVTQFSLFLMLVNKS